MGQERAVASGARHHGHRGHHRGCPRCRRRVYGRMGLDGRARRRCGTERIALLRPYQVDAAMMAATGKPDAKFMHCLPAFHDLETEVGQKMFDRHGLTAMEVTDDVFESEALDRLRPGREPDAHDQGCPRRHAQPRRVGRADARRRGPGRQRAPPLWRAVGDFGAPDADRVARSVTSPGDESPGATVVGQLGVSSSGQDPFQPPPTSTSTVGQGDRAVVSPHPARQPGRPGPAPGARIVDARRAPRPPGCDRPVARPPPAAHPSVHRRGHATTSSLLDRNLRRPRHPDRRPRVRPRRGGGPA